MTIPIEKKAPLLDNFYQRLEEDGWNFQECECSSSLFQSRLTLARADRITNFAVAGPNEKDAPLLREFQVVIAEYKRLDQG